ncbi:MAG: phosphoserine phosphatase SerB [Succinivibrionaceae bacterium]|nr:phosphoserine phosphatase SerB [Succinivibrionaceae bacterium]
MAFFFLAGQGQGFDPDLALSELVARLSLTEIEVFRHEREGLHDSVLFSSHGQAGELEPRLRPLLLAGTLGFDAWCADRFPSARQRGGLVMDMDMTSVQIEGIDEIARRLGVFDEVAALTARAMHGEMDFKQSLRARVALLRGGPARVLDEVRAAMGETPGLGLLLGEAGRRGWVRGIASGGFVQLISLLEERYSLDFVRANCLGVHDGCLSGEVEGDIVGPGEKELAVRDAVARYALGPGQVVALGDGANDLPMLRAADLGIAFHAKPKVREAAPFMLDCCDLTAVALFLRALESLPDGK